MAISRYTNSPKLDLNRQYGTSYLIPIIRENIKNGNIRTKEISFNEGMRLDTIAGIEYGDGRYWWVIAAGSNIGYGLAVPPGTYVVIPDINDVLRYIG